MGDKLAARRAAREAGLPVLPGPDAPIDPDTPPAATTYPVLVKAAAGGGGRGIRQAHDPDELARAVAAARREAQATFDDPTVYLEPLVPRARHIEVQILGDGQGRVLCLGERECSIQRRRQKLIEEAPAPNLTAAQRSYVHAAAVRLGRALRYRSLGTVEFLLDPDGEVYFIEVNPRIQVEHPVTEMVTGVDLVKAQLRLAAGRPLRYTQEQITLRGAAIEARVLAEDPFQGFLPTTGAITYLKEPGGPGVRVDSALYQGMTVTADYDSLLAKVIAWGEGRAVALRRLRRALHEFRIGGVATDLAFLVQIVDSPAFLAGRVDTTYLDTFRPRPPADPAQLERDAALAAALLAHRKKTTPAADAQPASAWRASAWRATAWREQM
jgi:acetyl/propionyl-CoA carboxylase alpha subunit